ncbi:hypothetical protein C8J57DRAFT_1233027 [Mycena rebaudengoi]|nr:hypothetical protein C8J57DRAFT_1233027 [Mycena rebaudengoi]
MTPDIHAVLPKQPHPVAYAAGGVLGNSSSAANSLPGNNGLGIGINSLVRTNLTWDITWADKISWVRAQCTLSPDSMSVRCGAIDDGGGKTQLDRPHVRMRARTGTAVPAPYRREVEKYLYGYRDGHAPASKGDPTVCTKNSNNMRTKMNTSFAFQTQRVFEAAGRVNLVFDAL